MSSRIYLVAAEPSGDALGADLIRAIRKDRPDTEFMGVGGARMAELGVASLFDTSDLSVLGLVEGIRAYGVVKQRVEETAQDIAANKPDAVVLIDSWGFMWRVAKRIKELGADAVRIKLVGPQVWATRPGRAKTLAAHVDHLLCIHAFETPFYAPYGLPTTVIGNPALSRMDKGDGPAFRKRHGISDTAKVILLLPGSRASEIKRVAPVLVEAARRLCQQDAERLVVCQVADSVRSAIESEAQGWDFPVRMSFDAKEKSDAFASADIALACSGTVTSEVALQGAPLIIGYKIGWVTWAIARAFLMKSRFITLLNVAANREIATEFVQTRFTARNLSIAAAKLLDDPGARETQVSEQFKALDTMGRGQKPAADIAADTILKILDLKILDGSR